MNTKTKVRLYAVHLLLLAFAWFVVVYSSRPFFDFLYFQQSCTTFQNSSPNWLFVLFAIVTGSVLMIYVVIAKDIWKLENVGRGNGKRSMGRKANTEKPRL